MSRPGDILRGRVQSQQGFKGGIGCCERKPGGDAGQCLVTSPRVADVTMTTYDGVAAALPPDPGQHRGGAAQHHRVPRAHGHGAASRTQRSPLLASQSGIVFIFYSMLINGLFPFKCLRSAPPLPRPLRTVQICPINGGH